MPIPRFDLKSTGLLIVDLQPRLLAVIDESERVVAQSEKLIRGAVALGLPVFVTEQYPEKLGETIPAIASVLPTDTERQAKLKFSACTAEVRQAVANSGLRRIILAGIEAHVCILQTALDFAEAGYLVGVVEDAVGSRRMTDRATALSRLQQAGIIPLSTEMILLEMVGEAGSDRFKSILPFIR